MIKLNTCFFIDIEACLIRTKSGKARAIALTDWNFNNEVIEYINNIGFDFVILIADTRVSSINNKFTYEKFVVFVQQQLIKILKTPVKLIYYNIDDDYFNYPYPGGLYSFYTDYDVNIYSSVYISDDLEAQRYSGIRLCNTYSKFLLSD